MQSVLFLSLLSAQTEICWCIFLNRRMHNATSLLLIGSSSRQCRIMVKSSTFAHLAKKNSALSIWVNECDIVTTEHFWRRLNYYFLFSSLLVVRRRNDELVMWTICYRASTSSVASSCSSSVAMSVVGGAAVSTTVSSTVSHSAYNVSTIAGRILPSLLDDSSASSACQASTPQSDKLVHYPKKVCSTGLME